MPHTHPRAGFLCHGVLVKMPLETLVQVQEAQHEIEKSLPPELVKFLRERGAKKLSSHAPSARHVASEHFVSQKKEQLAAVKSSELTKPRQAYLEKSPAGQKRGLFCMHTIRLRKIATFVW